MAFPKMNMLQPGQNLPAGRQMMVRPLTPIDAARIEQIERSSFAEPWSFSEILDADGLYAYLSADAISARPTGYVAWYTMEKRRGRVRITAPVGEGDDGAIDFFRSLDFEAVDWPTTARPVHEGRLLLGVEVPALPGRGGGHLHLARIAVDEPDRRQGFGRILVGCLPRVFTPMNRGGPA